MDIYNPGVISKKAWPKKTEVFFRKVFLVCSSAFAILIPIVLLDKSNVLAKLTAGLAQILAVAWFASFGGWIIFLVANSRIGNFLKSIGSKDASKKRRFGFFILLVWLISLILFVLFILFFRGANLSISSTVVSVLMWILIVILALFLPIWAFLIGNKLVKILSVFPIAFIVVLFLLYISVLRPHKTTGGSMRPNFVPGEYVLSEKITYTFHKPNRGDVVNFIPPISKSDIYFARIVGLSGEYISIRNDHVYINGKVLDEPYLVPDTQTGTGIFIGDTDVLIPEDMFAVMGDSRGHSNDSRHYGFVKRGSIKGRIYYVYWPPAKRGFVK